MTIEVIQRKTCDWCESDEDQAGINTHRLVFDRLAKEVELHAACIDDASLSHLLAKGRRAESIRPPAPTRKTETPTERKSNGTTMQVTCSLCPKRINVMGKGRHTVMHTTRNEGTPTYTPI